MSPDWQSDTPLQRLLDALLAVGSDLQLSVVLRRIVESATSLVDARYGAVGVIGPAGTLVEFVTTGLDQEVIDRIGPLPRGRGILGRLIHHPEPLRLTDLTTHPDASGFPPGHPPMRSFLGVPVRVRDTVFGNLYLCDKQSAAEFDEEDESLAVALAAAAGVAVENARLHQRLQDVVVAEDRERIARDLHDKVIQQLFATGMSLQTAQRLTDDPELARRLTQSIDDLDATIREIRNTIFALHQPGVDVRAQVEKVIAEIDDRLGTATTLHVEGPVSASVPDVLAEHVLAVVREAVTNAHHHAGATTVDVLLRTDANCTIRVADDGSGIADLEAAMLSGGHGLANLAARAAELGGALRLLPTAGDGTLLEWRVPLGTEI